MLDSPLLARYQARKCSPLGNTAHATGKQAIAFEAASFMSHLTAHGPSLEFKGELKRWPILSMVCDKECLILLHRLRQFLKIGLSQLSGQKICPALRMHSILHHPLVVIR
jgi:hypothetical protein